MGYFRTYSYPNFDFYVEPEDGPWTPCPVCELPPRVWRFDNGQFTVCGCRSDWSDYACRHISAPSIMTYARQNNGNMTNWDRNSLRYSWDAWCRYAGATERSEQ